MITMTVGARHVVRVFAGSIRTAADVEKFADEVTKELRDGYAVFCEVWKDTEQITKRLSVPTEEEELLATNGRQS